jgi:hypothetical protein
MNRMASKSDYERSGKRQSEVKDALDDIRDSAGPLVVGSSFFLYAGRVHPYLACDCARNTSHSTYIGQKSRLSKAQFRNLHKTPYTRYML